MQREKSDGVSSDQSMILEKNGPPGRFRAWLKSLRRAVSEMSSPAVAEFGLQVLEQDQGPKGEEFLARRHMVGREERALLEKAHASRLTASRIV